MPLPTTNYYGANYAPAQYTPAMNPALPPQPVERQTIFMMLDNEDSANAYPLAPMYTAYLMTKDEKILFKKSTDEYGRIQCLNKYQVIKEEEPVEISQIDYVTKDQLQGFVKQKDYDELLEMIGNLEDELSNLKNEPNSRGRKAGKQQ